ncbi:hypothetical protein [Burkholderia territorii]|uniref:hypothetical protein n=1 Tax=Burkholderia territorii TaxID=1503055 RepID=UPI000ABFBB7A|nr:hypothetical protein [Burkholderia territorii]
MAIQAKHLEIFFLAEHSLHYIIPTGESLNWIDDWDDVVNLNLGGREFSVAYSASKVLRHTSRDNILLCTDKG